MLNHIYLLFASPTKIAQKQLKESRISALESARLALYHKAESDCQKIYADMHMKHTNALLAQLADWTKESMDAGDSGV